jgi:hypothetical protein
MSTSEYLGWIAYFEEKDRKSEAKKGNLMAMNEEELIGKFAGDN